MYFIIWITIIAFVIRLAIWLIRPDDSEARGGIQFVVFGIIFMALLFYLGHFVLDIF
jgi:hypothetical protein